MLTSKMLHLSLGSRLNDLSEPLQKSHHAYAKWSHSYVASFAFGKMENIAMWAMYKKEAECGLNGLREYREGKTIELANNQMVEAEF